MSSDSCGNCEQAKEDYQNEIDEEMQRLVSFRGHGCPMPNLAKEEKPFSKEEIIMVLKLISVGVKKVHFTTRYNVRFTMNGVTIETNTEETSDGYEASIIISSPNDCEQVIYLTSSDGSLQQISRLGNEKLTFKLKDKEDKLTWAVHFGNNDMRLPTWNYLEDVIDPCLICTRNKEEIREMFFAKMKKNTNFRGHGMVYKVGDLRNIAWEPFKDDEILTLLRLIRFGVKLLNFTIRSDTQLDVEFEGVRLITKFSTDFFGTEYNFKLTILFPAERVPRVFIATLLDHRTANLSTALIKNTTGSVSLKRDPKMITWSIGINPDYIMKP